VEINQKEELEVHLETEEDLLGTIEEEPQPVEDVNHITC